ncbi:hypothetical protein CAEBREN_22228 [Caenorhabditis brenneri]|uniref:Uncharacterized protein n=1 Tax=Caenorhabditis brenneri TaxID=135651 RepID=G0MWA7_CAEBE|nr:hypothetical protein CAEBREN_22228 [Caenorhabditis brenneri]
MEEISAVMTRSMQLLQ